MNQTQYNFLLTHPGAIREKHLPSLEEVLREFPFFQSARALFLKGLYNQDSYKYNQALKTTAAHTQDRSVLFEFITSGKFVNLQESFHHDKEARIREIAVYGSEILTHKIPDANVSPVENALLNSIREAAKAETGQAVQVTEKLGIGKPLHFSKEETHSFSEWLQLAGLHPINRAEIKSVAAEKQKKFDLIDRFIERNPKIPPVKNDAESTASPLPPFADTSVLMTETLARVYLEQKKYAKAIQAYEILILKYPEKSSFFADRISDIKLLQQNNN